MVDISSLEEGCKECADLKPRQMTGRRVREKEGKLGPHAETRRTGTHLRSRLDAPAVPTGPGAQLSQTHATVCVGGCYGVGEVAGKPGCRLRVVRHGLHSVLTRGEAKVKGIFYC